MFDSSKTSGMSSVMLCESKSEAFNDNVDKDNGGKIKRRQIFVVFQLVSLDRVYCVHDTVTSGFIIFYINKRLILTRLMCVLTVRTFFEKLSHTPGKVFARHRRTPGYARRNFPMSRDEFIKLDPFNRNISRLLSVDYNSIYYNKNINDHVRFEKCIFIYLKIIFASKPFVLPRNILLIFYRCLFVPYITDLTN